MREEFDKRFKSAGEKMLTAKPEDYYAFLDTYADGLIAAIREEAEKHWNENGGSSLLSFIPKITTNNE